MATSSSSLSSSSSSSSSAATTKLIHGDESRDNRDVIRRLQRNATPPKSKAGQGTKEYRKSHVDGSDKICGFHPLRSLRNIFFGYRSNKNAAVFEDDAEPVLPPKSKSTDDITDQLLLHGRDNDDDTATTTDDATTSTTMITRSKATTTSTTTTSTTTKVVSCRRKSRASSSMINKQLSVSADNLLGSDEWIPAPHGIPSVVVNPPGVARVGGAGETSGASLNVSCSGIDDVEHATVFAADDFFVSRWICVEGGGGGGGGRSRAFSSGDAELIDRETVDYDLNSVHPSKGLDVSVVKDKIAVRPKGQRVSVAMQQKIQRGRRDDVVSPVVKTTGVKRLNPTVEMEGEGGGVGVGGGGGEEETPTSPKAQKITEVEKREKCKLSVATGNHSNHRKTIGNMLLTPEMLSSSSSSSSSSAAAAAAAKKPPATKPKQKSPHPSGDGNRSGPPGSEPASPTPLTAAATDVKKGGVDRAGHDVVTRRQANDPQTAGDDKTPRSTAVLLPPPRVWPKTRPKTIMNEGVAAAAAAASTPGVPSPAGAETEPEWLKMAKKNRVVPQ